MEIVTINARINKKKKAEFFQTMESLKSLVIKYCNDFKTEINPDDKLVIRITFAGKDELEKNFHNAEFNILKGTVRSLCDNVSYKINDMSVI